MYDSLTERPLGALMYDSLDSYREVIRFLSEYIRHNSSTCGAAFHNRAVAHWEIGEIDKAIADFDRAEEMLRKDYMPSHIKGLMLRKLGRLNEAIGCADRAISIEPSAVTARRSRAAMLVEVGRLKEALAEYDCAVELEPSFKHTREVRDGLALRIAEAEGDENEL